jgi:hypothetical protein
MGDYTHGRGLKSQLADGVMLICRFYLPVKFWRVTPLKYSLRSGPGGGLHAGTDREDFAVFLFLSPQWQADADSSGGGTYQYGFFLPILP